MSPELKYQQLAAEALKDKPRVDQLPMNIRSELTFHIGEMVRQLEQDLGGRWNNVGFVNSRVQIGGRKDDYDEHKMKAELLKNVVKRQGIHGRTAAAIVDTTFRDAVFMVQAGVSTLEELTEFRSRSKRTIVGPGGRELHSNQEGPPNQKMVTLKQGNSSSI